MNNYVENQKQLTWSRIETPRIHHGIGVIAIDHNIYLKNNRYSIDANTLDLEIKDATADDEGTYECRVLPENIVLTIHLELNKGVTLKIYKVVQGTGHKQDVTNGRIQVKSKSRIELECKDISGITQNYEWLSTANIKRERGFYVEENGKFVIESVDSHHAGLYQCIVENEDKSKPKITEKVEIVVECEFFI